MDELSDIYINEVSSRVCVRGRVLTGVRLKDGDGDPSGPGAYIGTDASGNSVDFGRDEIETTCPVTDSVDNPAPLGSETGKRAAAAAESASGALKDRLCLIEESNSGPRFDSICNSILGEKGNELGDFFKGSVKGQPKRRARPQRTAYDKVPDIPAPLPVDDVPPPSRPWLDKPEMDAQGGSQNLSSFFDRKRPVDGNATQIASGDEKLKNFFADKLPQKEPQFKTPSDTSSAPMSSDGLAQGAGTPMGIPTGDPSSGLLSKTSGIRKPDVPDGRSIDSPGLNKIERGLPGDSKISSPDIVLDQPPVSGTSLGDTDSLPPVKDPGGSPMRPMAGDIASSPDKVGSSLSNDYEPNQVDIDKPSPSVSTSTGDTLDGPEVADMNPSKGKSYKSVPVNYASHPGRWAKAARAKIRYKPGMSFADRKKVAQTEYNKWQDTFSA